MTSDLDKKLRSVIVQIDKRKPVVIFLDKNALDENDIEYLSQKAIGFPKESLFVLVDGNPEQLVQVKPLMTGQEWYNRFDKELKGKIFAFDENGSEKIVAAVNACHDAARKAAGIDQ